MRMPFSCFPFPPLRVPKPCTFTSPSLSSSQSLAPVGATWRWRSRWWHARCFVHSDVFGGARPPFEDASKSPRSFRLLSPRRHRPSHHLHPVAAPIFSPVSRVSVPPRCWPRTRRWRSARIPRPHSREEAWPSSRKATWMVPLMISIS